MAVCTVIGFPNGYMTTWLSRNLKHRMHWANGETDRYGDQYRLVKDGRFDCIEEEIRTSEKACGAKI